MRHLIAALIALLAALPVSAACVGENLIEALPPERRAALEAAVAEHAYPEGNLWRAEKDGRIVHVVGTIHIADPRLDPIVAEVAPLLETTDVLVLETTSDEQASLERRIAENPEIAFITEGPTLIDLLGEEAWATLADDLEARGLPPFMAAKFQPWFLGLTLAVPLCALEDLTSGKKGLDGRLEEMAQARGLPIAKLDDTEAVLDALRGGTMEEQLDMLRAGLLVEFDQDAGLATTLDSYFAGRHRELWEFSRFLSEDMEEGAEAFETLEANLLDGRNVTWQPMIAEIVAGQDAVIAVGAAHLSGETGVLRTLERLGFTLTRL